jgi:hypothetical protein
MCNIVDNDNCRCFSSVVNKHIFALTVQTLAESHNIKTFFSSFNIRIAFVRTRGESLVNYKNPRFNPSCTK